jgi:hypothetical protein
MNPFIDQIVKAQFAGLSLLSRTFNVGVEWYGGLLNRYRGGEKPQDGLSPAAGEPAADNDIPLGEQAATAADDSLPPPPSTEAKH